MERAGADSAGRGRDSRRADTVSGAECQCYAERFVRSIKEECLNRVIPIGDRHLRRMIAEYVEHYHRERNHQGLANELIEGVSTGAGNLGRIRRRSRLDGLLNDYCRAA